MSTKKTQKQSNKITVKARAVLAFAQEHARQAADWVDLSNALFGLKGKATLAFPTESERTACCKTPEYKQVLALMDNLPPPPVKEFVELFASANGAKKPRHSTAADFGPAKLSRSLSS